VDEPDLVALREVVPSATAPLRLVDHVDRDVTLGTLLPGGLPAMVRADGRILLSLQTASRRVTSTATSARRCSLRSRASRAGA